MHDRTTDTSIARPMHMKDGHLDACLIHIYPSGPTMGRRYSLGTDALQIGRGETCAIRVQDSSVSRRHAEVEPGTDGFFIKDLGSTNGTFVNDKQLQTGRRLKDGDYVRTGNCIFRFLTGGNIEAEYHEEIYRLTIMDGLTKIHNQRYLLEFLDRELARSRRHRRPLAILMIDLDSFKRINDEFGHLCGDHVLRELSDRIRGMVRREDLFARYGGEEFCLVLVETHQPQAVEVADRVRASIAEKPFPFEGSPIPVTVSIGVSFTEGERNLTPAEILKEADEKLYAAKRAGRNRVIA